jgi:hypothetical protein
MQLSLFPEDSKPVNATSGEYHECPHCKEFKHESHYHTQHRISKPNWLKVSEGCKTCYAESCRLKYQLHKEAPPKTDYCECCHRNFQEHGLRIELDHCHTKRVFNGWLCAQCNGGLGRFEDNIERLEKAIAYLRIHDES